MEEKLALEYLDTFNSSTIRLGLKNVMELMKRLDDPQDKLKIIHIGGTNGKGSTSAFINQALIQNGYKVGCFNSPYLVTPRENIRINDTYISEKDFLKYIKRVTEIALTMREEGYGPSYFEVMVGVALTYFYEQQVDFVILEVGLGGALDGTNVMKKPLLSVLTKLSIDHKDFLGDTLTSIAMQKAGIIKLHSTVITGVQEPEVMTVFEEACDKQEAQLIVAPCDQIHIEHMDEEGTCFSLRDKNYEISLIGAHQAYNCTIALTVLEKLQEFGISLEEEKIKLALKETKWGGRFEKISSKPLFFIDGAHNVDGIEALKKTIEMLPKRYTIGIVGILKDKEVEEMLEMIIPSFDALVVTTPQNPRAMGAHALADKIKAFGKAVYITKDILEAKSKAIDIANHTSNSQIIGFGSLYMIGELK